MNARRAHGVTGFPPQEQPMGAYAVALMEKDGEIKALLAKIKDLEADNTRLKDLVNGTGHIAQVRAEQEKDKCEQ